MTRVSDFRIQKCNGAGENPQGDYVLYWMIANRRTYWNFSLQRAVEWSHRFGKPLMILEALRCGYQWASDRLHRFIMEGMQDNAARLKNTGVLYYPYLEPVSDAGKGLLRELSKRACVVITDDFPAFFLPRMVASAARQLSVFMEKVDSNGILPIHWTDRIFLTAFSFRRFLQNNIEPQLHSFPAADPLAQGVRPFDDQLPGQILDHWPPAKDVIESKKADSLDCFPINHSVTPSPIRGGEREANNALQFFLKDNLHRYSDCKNHPDDNVTSGLAPYLHFGHISVYQIFHELKCFEGWSRSRVLEGGRGQREGWWGMSRNAEAFLDQLITWRELGYNMCANLPTYDSYESLPCWAQETLDRHRKDPRSSLYGIEQFENADTHDPIWNAAQRQLQREGTLHNYLRMLWGKKIFEWASSPEEALDIMIHLNNKYALDGRNPNSYSGIFWILGRYDRPWAPERPVFGKIRYMASQNAAKKLRLKQYLRKYSE
ncbi:MAG: deoxyribodipyrimidine photolyase [Desulfomonilaceae bacterium]